MSTFQEFKLQREAMRRRINPDKQYIRMDVVGLEAHQIVFHRDGGTILVAGIDERGKEAVVVMSEGHFYGKLSIEDKKAGREVTGFKIEKEKDTQSISN